MEERIIALITTFLGEYGKHSGDWYSFNCPNCAEMKGVRADNKYNFEVKVDLMSRGCGWAHCWACEHRMPLTALFKRYASSIVADEFRQIVYDFRSAKKYVLNEFSDGNVMADFGEDEFMLPDSFKPLNEEDADCAEAMAYLKSRNIDEAIIKRYNIGYIGNDRKAEFSLRNRIIIPSYDSFGNLNYWVGRDYTGKSKLRYRNPKVEKTKFIFNEGKINWYEPITLVEGPFDHIVVPNSIPLLGKTLNKDYALFDRLVKSAKSDVNVFLDADAGSSVRKVVSVLLSTPLRDNIKVIECPDGYDASLLYEKFGSKSIISLLSRAKRVDESDLITF